MFEELVINWFQNVIARAPELAILGLVALDLRKQIVTCMKETREMNKLFVTKLLEETEFAEYDTLPMPPTSR